MVDNKLGKAVILGYDFPVPLLSRIHRTPYEPQVKRVSLRRG
jgi:hypothetical protein